MYHLTVNGLLVTRMCLILQLLVCIVIFPSGGKQYSKLVEAFSRDLQQRHLWTLTDGDGSGEN